MLRQDHKRLLMERASIKLCANLGLVIATLCLLPLTGLSQEDCAGLTYEGKCTGNLVQWCEEGEVIQIDCTDLGMVCGWDEEKGYSCLGGDTMNICDLPTEGICASETVVQWCSAGELETLECKHGMICGWNNNHMYYDCVPEDGYGSGEDHSKNDEANAQESEEPRNENREDRSNEGISVETSLDTDASDENSGTSKYADEEFGDANAEATPQLLGQGETQGRQKEDMGLPTQSGEEPVLGGCQQQADYGARGFFLLLVIVMVACRRQTPSHPA